MSSIEHNAFRRSLLRGVMLLGACLGLLLVLFVSRAEDQMEVISLHHWLDAEVNQYYRDYARDPASVRAPNPYEFDTYWSHESVPQWLESYSVPGFYEHHLGPEDKHFRVVAHPSGQGLLYVVFKNDADDYLDQYETRLHWISIVMALATWGVAALGTLLLVRRLAQPLRNLVQKIGQIAPASPDFVVDAPYAELRLIESALLHSKQEIRAYFRREQEFSRFASHEIRTPLMVMRGSADVLKKLALQQLPAQRALQRIDAACEEMTLLTELFLLLGRGEIEAQRFQRLDLQTLLQETIAGLDWGGREVRVVTQGNSIVMAPPALVRVLLRNLLRNALLHGVGDVEATLENGAFIVSNTTRDNEDDAESYGYGLIIIERICERLDWRLQVSSEAGCYSCKVVFRLPTGV
ncbi:MAG: HAMP domain-containing histidine kinase [Gammaproteobacteria bacterium]|nr:HAMP domain-containing histidine kinase [Gammaproteobacteria bacterium]